MSIAHEIAKKVQELPPDRQQEVLDFVEFVGQLPRLRPGAPGQPRKSLAGLWSGYGIDISEAELREARKEMWGRFPRELP